MVFKQKLKLPVDAETVQTELSRIADSNGGVLDPQMVVNESRSESAPLHRLFEWDDTVAAEKYRVVQARFIIRNQIVEEDDTPTVRSFVHAGGDGYAPIRTALQSVDMTEALLKQAKADMDTFRAKYRALKSLAGIVQAMDEYEQTLFDRQEAST